ncbi:ATP-binding protein [Haloarchaeobius salinus]|uniref:ATP-binding protein n=1 Tax=Haloarchaeobius salinus TaxID=1198298 RepID=UPI0021098367|nr:PAS domain-containing sensor histidine kinase [Haloarchaeobius salinus]
MSGAVRLPEEFSALTTGVTLHDAETGTVLDGNDALERLYGYSVSELREMEISDYTAPSTKFTQSEALRRIRAAAGGDPQSFDWQVERANNTIIWVAVELTDIEIDGVQCVLAEIRDITEYKTRERRLRLLNRVVRHNLRNETTVLMGYADRLKDAIESERLEEEIQTVLDIAEEIGSLSSSIQEFEEIADPNGTTRSRTSMNEVVREHVVAKQEEHPAADVRLDERDAVWVLADDGIDYAVDHAIENAIVHNDHEHPSVEVTVRKDPESDRGEIRVIDDGPPIPEIEIEVLDASETKTDTYHGSGLGLWVMQWCIDSLGGELVFEGNEPRGNVVRILLPLDDGVR